MDPRQQAIESARSHPLAYYSLRTGRPIHSMHRRLWGGFLAPCDSYAEVPRGHGKTTSGAVCLEWLLGNWPSLRVKIVGPSDPEGSKTAAMLREGIESPLFQAVFPEVEVCPGDKSASRWSLTGRRTGARDDTVEAGGIFGVAGGRWDILWMDDISNLRNSILQPADRERVKESVINTWMPMRDIAAPGPIPSRIWKTATPYHAADVTADWRKEHTANGTILRLPCTEENGRRVSPWPEGFTSAALDEQYGRMGPLGYGRAYGLVPLSSDMMVFKPEWLLDRLYRDSDLPVRGRLTTIAAIDFAYTKATAQKANPDWSCCIVAEVSMEGHAYATDILRMREPFTTFRDALIPLLESRGVTRAYAEANGPQAGVAEAFAEHCRVPVVPLSRHEDQMVRATQEQSFVAAGRMHLPGEHGIVRQDFAPVVEEALTFPAGDHDDCLSAMLDICNAARTGDGQRSGSRLLTSPGLGGTPIVAWQGR